MKKFIYAKQGIFNLDREIFFSIINKIKIKFNKSSSDIIKIAALYNNNVENNIENFNIIDKIEILFGSLDELADLILAAYKADINPLPMLRKKLNISIKFHTFYYEKEDLIKGMNIILEQESADIFSAPEKVNIKLL